MAQLDVWAELLGPVARDAAADGEDSEAGVQEIFFSKMVEVEEGIEADEFASLLGALAIVQGNVKSHLGVGEGRDVNRGALFIGRAQDAAAFGLLGEVLAN